jgi:hypothetical protein
MTHATHTFANDLIKPWDELNQLLVQRYAFHPDLSDVTRFAQTLAVSIKHQIDVYGLEIGKEPKAIQADVNSDDDARLISDFADTAKHRTLRDPSRQAQIFVVAQFEESDKGFRFIRNSAIVEHCSLGKRDFLASARGAIEYWIKKRNLPITWRGTIAEAPVEFSPTAFLHYNAKYCIHTNSARFQFFRRKAGGELEPFDPPTVRVEIY